MKFTNTLRTLAAACAFVATTHASAAPVLLVDSNGILTGATGVDVGGTLYNVKLAAGSCNSLFNGCVESAFNFRDINIALLAAQSLLDQVFVDSAAGQFNSDASKVLGCSLATQNRYCFSLIPTRLQATSGGNTPRVEGGAVINYSAGGSNPLDRVELNGLYRNADTVDFNTYNYALFEVAAPIADVPEPASIALFGLAMAGLAFNRRRKV